LKVWETFRSHARQIMLFNQKATKLRSVGVHHYGLAADIVKWDGEPSWRGDWAFMGTLAREFGLHWGGDWDDNSKTLNHFNDLGPCAVYYNCPTTSIVCWHLVSVGGLVSGSDAYTLFCNTAFLAFAFWY
jgi:hypothetical protein